MSQAQDCCTSHLLGKGAHRGLMGPAHINSGLGFYILLLGLFPSLVALVTAGASDSIGFTLVVIMSALCVAGSALIPDFDNTRSTIINSAGPMGEPLSMAFRESSRFIQRTVRTRRDKSNPNPHRGFWHTFAGAIVLGLAVHLLVHVSLPLAFGLSIGEIIGAIITAFLAHITLGMVVLSYVKTNKIPLIGQFVDVVLALALTLALFLLVPGDSFEWLGLSITIGMAIHILGDALTKQGVPMLFPLPIRGKLWWNIRFTMLEAKNKGLNLFITGASFVAVVLGFALFQYHGSLSIGV